MDNFKYINFRIPLDYVSVSGTKLNVNSLEDIWVNGGTAPLTLNRGARWGELSASRPSGLGQGTH